MPQVSKEEKQNLRKPGDVFDLQQEYWVRAARHAPLFPVPWGPALTLSRVRRPQQRLQEQDKDDDWKIVPMPRPPVPPTASASP